MKRYISILSILIGLLLSILACKPEGKLTRKPHNEKEKNLIQFKENELIVIYSKPPNPEIRGRIQNTIKEEIPEVTFDTIRTCSKCDEYVELWEGENIHTFIQERLLSGTRKGSGLDGEDVDYYSLNIISRLPIDTPKDIPSQLNPHKIETKPKGDKIIVAVLDTGVDPVKIDNSFLWENGGECYPIGIDDHYSLHGTFVSQYIINQFSDSPNNAVRIMNLKTHNRKGEGTLFDIICAIRFAKSNGANIINASWGLEFTSGSHPYLDILITKELKQAGILFFAAAGNNDPMANRNLDDNHYYPAYLSNDTNNVITVTTTDGISLISPNQNYSNNHVDLGVKADRVEPDHMFFQIPFERPIQYITGSSFATPIAAGKIGAALPIDKYRELPDMDKNELINAIRGSSETPIIFVDPRLNGKIRKGQFIIK